MWGNRDLVLCNTVKTRCPASFGGGGFGLRAVAAAEDAARWLVARSLMLPWLDLNEGVSQTCARAMRREHELQVLETAGMDGEEELHLAWARETRPARVSHRPPPARTGRLGLRTHPNTRCCSLALPSGRPFFLQRRCAAGMIWGTHFAGFNFTNNMHPPYPRITGRCGMYRAWYNIR